jgi:hypothetical protein
MPGGFIRDGHDKELTNCFGDILGIMKRVAIAATAVLAGSIPFQPEIENPECNAVTCAIEQSVKVPEQPHASEEPPAFEATEDLVAITFSPVTSVKRGSEYHLQWLRDNGFDESQVSVNPFDLYKENTKAI